MRFFVPTIDLARTSALANKSVFTTWLTIPSCRAKSALIRVPVQMSSIDFSMPINLGKRCVPPAPGIIPRVTSGNPSTVPSNAIRASHPKANSNPPPKAAPCKAHTTGFEQFSIAAITKGKCGSIKGCENSLISDPAINVVPLPIITAAVSFRSASSA